MGLSGCVDMPCSAPLQGLPVLGVVRLSLEAQAIPSMTSGQRRSCSSWGRRGGKAGGDPTHRLGYGFGALLQGQSLTQA